jgi:hypothetical protein
MKITYLDQNHWIELSKAVYSHPRFSDTPRVLEALCQARISGRACFPISYAHYLETRKHGNAEARTRLATLMWLLSGGMTVASIPTVIRHEIEVALEHCFPGRVVPEPFQLLGFGLTHTAGSDWNVPLPWPPGADNMPAPWRALLEAPFRVKVEFTLLSGVSQIGEPLEWRPLTSGTRECQYGTELEQWRGARKRYARDDDLEREIYTSTLGEINGELQDAFARHNIAREYAQLSESQRWALLDAMPWQKAVMHLKRQWAKNARLKPNKRHSDLNDWGYLSVAVSHCDIIVTERHMANLFSPARGFHSRATVIPRLGQLPELVA